jgi:CRP/FNR family transcriptional regulator, cyclic AMP receptor protein
MLSRLECDRGHVPRRPSRLTAVVSAADPVELAVRRSVLASLPPAVLDRLLSDALRLDIPAGSVLYREGDAPRCGLLVSGLARVYLTAADGRQVTIRYMVSGSLSGASLVVSGAPSSARVQAVSDVVGLILNVGTLRSLARSDAEVAWALATEVAHSQEEIIRAFGTSVFGSVRQRVARQVLDLAAMHHQPGRPLVAPVTQQELADAAGCAREVVTRLLRELRDDGVVDTARGGVALLDPARLHALVEPVSPG